ncbi:ABC transporter permease [Tianweitania sp. BSSL-BM11]|uniref:ABC transporter permease n=1 Tax=Tianweitania aestuarii TaxID=2814886 RepID=A0ABS5RWN0_9HYPH|nr:ABC transporter permease [Tianweitania aestuarii]MBS9721436.1 ABC transporter permease [Tianweitania aestuarii]
MSDTKPYLDRWTGLALLLPMAALLAVFFVLPLARTIWQSVYEYGFTLRAYEMLLTSTLFWKVLQTTFAISFTATIVALLAGYPVALHLSRLPPSRRMPYLVMVMLPFWTSILVKSFALIVLLGYDGIINNALSFISGQDIHIPMVFNRVGAILGMTNYLLPFMILSILSSLLTQDVNLGRAAEVMGASRFTIFRRITLPLSMPGVLAGVLISFTLSIGMYITPALLGGRQDMMMANLIDFYTRQTLDWPLASAIAVVLLFVSGVLVAMLGKVRGSAGMREMSR